MSCLRYVFERVAAETLQIAESASLAVDRFARTVDMPPAIRLQAIKDLLAEIQTGRSRALELSGILPSPNGVPASLAQSVETIAKALFNFIRLCDTRVRVLSVMESNMSRQLMAAQ